MFRKVGSGADMLRAAGTGGEQIGYGDCGRRIIFDRRFGDERFLGGRQNSEGVVAGHGAQFGQINAAHRLAGKGDYLQGMGCAICSPILRQRDGFIQWRDRLGHRFGLEARRIQSGIR